MVLGLDYEKNTMDEFKTELVKYDPNRTKFLVSQKIDDEIEEGVRILKELYKIMGEDKREEVPISKLKIGLKCGGSDEFSDYLISHGDTTVLTEVPEMFGAETILMNRAESLSVFKDIVNLINGFKRYFIDHKQPIYENPALGNKEGGIITLEEKSLGCIENGGKSVVVDVLKYGEVIRKKD